MKTAKKANRKPLIGFIGQGWIGKHYADDVERRGYPVVRYSLEKPYVKNKAKIKKCDIVFIAVPTPTSPAKGFDDSIVRSAVKLVGRGKTAVIKSTLLPGTTEAIQKTNPTVFVLNSPEFLSVSTAAYDAGNPSRNIVGIPTDTPEYRRRAEEVLRMLPKALYKLTYNFVTSAREAELIKYGRNYLGFVRVVAINLFYDLAKELDVDWNVIREAMSADPDNGPTYMNPESKNGRGAGGECFIKDFAAFKDFYDSLVTDPAGAAVLTALEQKNIELLVSTKKDLNLLKGVYGDEIINSHSKSR